MFSACNVFRDDNLQRSGFEVDAIRQYPVTSDVELEIAEDREAFERYEQNFQLFVDMGMQGACPEESLWGECHNPYAAGVQRDY